MSWRVKFTTRADDEPAGNVFRFAGRQEAMLYGDDLKESWDAVRTMTAEESQEPVNVTWDEGDAIVRNLDGEPA